jgi:hypothetical protein
MTLAARLPITMVHEACGGLEGRSDDEITDGLIEAITDAFETVPLLLKVAEHGCSLRYVDTNGHPFRDLGDWMTLAGLCREELEGIPDEAACISVSLPFAKEALALVQYCAGRLGVPADRVGDTVAVMLHASLAVKRWERGQDDGVRPVVRGVATDLANLAEEVELEKVAGVLDTPASAGKAEVWAREADRPDDAPVFFVFE